MKPIKVEIINELTNYSCGGSFDTLEEAQAYVDKQKAKSKHPMGKPERYIKTEELPAELVGRVLNTRTVEPQVEEGEVAESYEESLVQCDYVVTITDFSEDLNHLTQVCTQNRQREYAKIDSLLKEALVEKELGDSTKWNEYVALREQIKIDNPKPE